MFLGSGKTAAFLMPILNQIFEDGPPKNVPVVCSLSVCYFYILLLLLLVLLYVYKNSIVNLFAILLTYLTSICLDLFSSILYHFKVIEHLK